MYIFLFFLISLCSRVGSSSAITTSNLFLRDPDEISSTNNNFKLGFFSPPNSTNRYIGISYNTGSGASEVVWVANRENPIKGSSGVLKLSEDGQLLALDGRNEIIWSTNTTDRAANSSTAGLEDNGNLVLRSDVGEIIWQSFQHPTHTLLPHMSIAINNTNTYDTLGTFRSWKSLSDPSSGRFTVGVTPSRRLFEVFVWDDGRPYWRTGPWNGNIFIGLPISYNWGQTNLFSNLNGNTNRPILTFLPQPQIPDYIVLAYDGKLEEKAWNETNRKWDITWRSIETECDVYGTCGAFGRCNPRKLPICRCLDGFEPRSNQEWRNGNWTKGCTRRTPLQCRNDTITGKPDGFLRVQSIKVPDYAEPLDADDEEGCRRLCLANCLCLAYTFPLGIGCIIWNRTLIDIQDFNATAIDVFIRVAHSEIADKSIKWKTILAIGVIVGIIAFAVVAFFCWRRISPHARKRTKRKYILLRNSMPELISEVEFKDLPLFEFKKLADATSNFHVSNKLGQGGFGPVFKGKLKDGQEVAVKRLLRASGQGLKEFMNEVLLISKLQHRNLVRLLGCCVEGEERLLVYEYMPNKSLDALLFDPLHQEHLDWKTRFNIIKGICRGLLYLHRDSRLRIIHRDLKPSNILLDEDLNPKISDFGMAKIFGDVEDQGNTSRVVGTYGYMSPEYAMQGRVSEKLDVFSFGVMLLEIISGKRNGSFQNIDEALSISGHAWNLWNEDDVLSLIDPNIGDPCFQEEISKCILIGLLCVQEFPEDRPTISTVISMFDSEILDLPCPMQPGFNLRRNSLPTRENPNGEPNCSINNVSITILGGR